MKSALPSQNVYTVVPGAQLLQQYIIGYVYQSYHYFLIDLYVIYANPLCYVHKSYFSWA